MSRFIQQAFDKVCPKAVQAESWYVVLMDSIPYYGGPEEGGWWGRDTEVIAFQKFPTEGLAKQAAEAVRELAKEMNHESRMEHGKQCLREMDWLEARGLEADWLPEPDGPGELFVTVTENIPEGTRGCRHYE